MALQSITGGLWLPAHFVNNAGASFGTTLVLDAANETAGFVVMASKTGNIDRVCFRLGSVSVTSGPLTFDCRLETVDASTGLPTGTLLGTDSNLTFSIADTDDNTWKEITLTTAVAVTKGSTVFAVVIKAPASGTFNVQISTVDIGGATGAGRFPYIHLNGAHITQRTPISAFRYDDAAYSAPPGLLTWNGISSSNIDSTTSPDEVGNKFQFPFKAKVDAISFIMDPVTAGVITIRIYNASDTAIMEMTYDPDNSNSLAAGHYDIPLDDEITIEAATIYRVTVRPDAVLQRFYYVDFDSATMLGVMEGGSNIHATERTDNGAWTDTTTRRYLMTLRCSALDDGAGGSGGSPNGGGASLTFSPFG